MRRRGLTIAAVLAALLALPGCLGGDEEKPSEGAQTQPDTAAEEPQATETTPSGEPVEVPEEPVATRDGEITGNPVTVDLLGLQRGGETVVLTLRLTSEEEGFHQVGEAFDDGVRQQIEGETNTDAPVNLTSMDGITLIDTKNRKRHLVGRDSRGVCACDTDLGGAVFGAEPLFLSATYAAPPDDVTAMDVLVPGFGAFKDVPIS